MSRAAKPSSLTDEEKVARVIRARRRFKAVIRLVIANNAWLMESEEEQTAVSDNVAKNIHLLTRKKRGLSGSVLTLREKSILRKSVIGRTEAEKHLLRMKLGNFKAFRQFPPEVKYELPTVMFFIYYGPGREVLRQGADPLNMYVIVSGEVVVIKHYWDNLLKCEVKKDLATLGAGSIFGEASLLYDIKRTATITTLTPCELLYLTDDDFRRVIKDPLMRIWNKIRDSISSFRYFDKLTEIDIREGCMVGKKKMYREGDIIVSNAPATKVYFVTKGSVYMLEYILIGTETKNGKKLYKHLDEKYAKIDPAEVGKSKEIKMFLKEVDDAEKKSHVSATHKAPQGMTVKWHFIKICSHYKLGSFNLGESLRNRLIVAESEEVECLILPRDFLDEKCDVTFRNVELYLNKNLPTPKNVFQSFLKNKAWIRYKENLVSDILKRRNSTPVNSIHNVPYSIRLTEDFTMCG